MKYLPNSLSAIRILLVLPTAWLLWAGDTLSALGLMLVAGCTDALDGALARRYDWQSELGALIDPIADKLLVAAIFIVFTLKGVIPLWLVALIIGRDLMIVLGASIYRMSIGQFDARPSVLSKINTAAQILVLLLLMTAQLREMDLSLLLTSEAYVFCVLMLAVLSIASGLHYALIWFARFRLDLARVREVNSRPGSVDRADS